ncbi:hypothetical protein Tco_0262385 [Tanacetum coccineum]
MIRAFIRGSLKIVMIRAFIRGMATFEVLDELMEIILHKRMRFWFVQVISEEERRSWVAIDSLESLKQTYARETAKLAGLTDVMVETLAGIHEKEGHVARLDLND